MTQSIADVLDRAADLIAKGWMQGDWGSFRGECFCAWGAIMFGESVMAGESERKAAHQFAKQHIGAPSLISWNDTPGRTQAEVVQALREAAAKAREQSS